MTTRELTACALAFIGGFGGLANALAWMSIAGALNKQRPSNDQIPVYNLTLEDLRTNYSLSARYGFSRWKLVKEFRARFPESRLHLWYVGGLVWMFCFVIAAAALLFGK